MTVSGHTVMTFLVSKDAMTTVRCIRLCRRLAAPNIGGDNRRGFSVQALVGIGRKQVEELSKAARL